MEIEKSPFQISAELLEMGENCQYSGFENTLAGSGVMLWTIFQLPQLPPTHQGWRLEIELNM